MFTPGHVLCVDFGTSNTVAYLHWPDGRTKVLLFDGTPLLPSAVFAPPSGGLAVGRDALHHGRHQPGLLEPNPKRRIDDGKVLLGDREIEVPGLIGAVLARVGDEAVRVAGSPPDTLVLSHPAGWGPVRRLTLADAAEIADLPAPKFVVEPVAAARYFAGVLGGAITPGQALVVYDLGAGTFDVSVIRDGRVLGSDGIDNVGGVDFDAAVVGWLKDRYEPAQWARLSLPANDADLRLRLDLWSEARVAKEMLSRTPSALMRPPLLADEVVLTLEDFERLAQPLVDRTVRAAVALTRYCGVTPNHVLLVGGSSRIPLVATALHRAFGLAPTVTEQPETVVAEGGVPTQRRPSADDDTVSLQRVVPAQRRAAESPARTRVAAVHAVATQPAVRPAPAPPRPVVAPPPPEPRSESRSRRGALVFLVVLFLVASLAAVALVTDVFQRDRSGDDGAGPGPSGASPSASAPQASGPQASGPQGSGFPDWPARYSDSLHVQRNFSAGALPAESATCAFNQRLEISMQKAGIYRCPGQLDALTDFALTINLYLASGEPDLPCAGIWFRRHPHEDGKDSAYVVKVCATEMAIGHHHADGSIAPVASFPIERIGAEQKTNVGIAVKGDEISLYRAGNLVGSQRDGRYPNGRIALGIAVAVPPGVTPGETPIAGTVAYTDIEVRWP